ncbi:uncharacterized protein LOC119997451 [Tripterygium wilfordii]|uniref:uncharacterized protein LOC119997451 n=1 Tax=Tripterygium wilfordii TaxID=458696 RepID=UPI0018F803A6|nr:uncharacterized protein LOC119997451 [Tripterygium wilfordii]XP_038700409.1 uncharacterized protein LOC119997451 [Tripterygium wilfordii]XP_038700410.1 uncharacterized protein LOC119997451 [Tripterygium wilfordii]XP_038700411.1 uncharacterized protein LOC119997451 [Tripterygium wilfordii]
MEESNMNKGRLEQDIIDLEEALCAQQELLQKLYTELEVERESSATAASEALSMILRLQGEKATVKMEASHYKRMAEEKIEHAEEYLEMYEDLIYQRELEIASLEYQVQAYRCKLLSMGCRDLCDIENKFPENLLAQRSDTLSGEADIMSNLRRLRSMPALAIKDPYLMKSTIERKRSAVPLQDLMPKIVEEVENEVVNAEVLTLEDKSGSPTAGDFNSYWQQIRHLEERVKEISACKDSSRDKSGNWKRRSGSCTLISQESNTASRDPIRDMLVTLSQDKNQENLCEAEDVKTFACSSTVHDVFEVPESKEICEGREHQKKGWRKLISESENRLIKPDMAFEATLESSVKDAKDAAKKMLLCANQEKQLTRLRRERSVDFNLPLVPPKPAAESRADIQLLHQRIEQLERERHNVSQEITREPLDSKLLEDIHGQLNLILSEMRSWRSKKSPSLPEDSSLASLQEAMLYFWF